MPFVAVLDANVLWSAPLRDVILRAAERGLFRPVWSQQILEEMADSLKERLSQRRADFDPARIDYLVQQLVEAFPKALVGGYQDLIPAMQNDEKDRHVLAMAVRTGASLIVTRNTEHFPEQSRQPYEVDRQTPDQFLCHLWHLSPEDMAIILKQISEDLKKPPMTVAQVVENLRRSVPQFAQVAL